METTGTAKVLIAGGGVAALEAALALRALAEDRVSVELLAPESQFSYRPLAVAEPFGLGAMRRLELGELAAEAGATLTHGALFSVDVARRIAYTATGVAIPYSTLLVACGAVPKPAVDGALTFRGPPTGSGSRASSPRSRPARPGRSSSRYRPAPSGACLRTSSR